MKRIVALVFLFSVSIAVFAQSKREWLEYGDAAFKNGDYFTAVTFYLRVVDKATPPDITRPYEIRPYSPPAKVKKDSLSVNDTLKKVNKLSEKEQYVIHQIAESYRLNRDYKNAEIWFQKSLENNSPLYPFESYWYGDALMKNKKYAAANLQFETAMNASEKKDPSIFRLSKYKIAGCYMAFDTNFTHTDIFASELDTLFNAGLSSFALNYYGDPNTLQFTSARATNTITDAKTQKPQYTTDLYTINKTENVWGNVKKIDLAINTEKNEGSGFLTFDRNNYFFTRWSTTNKNECSIYFMKFMSEKWYAAGQMNDKINLEGYKSMSPTLSADGSILYFSSDRPGGYGKMDIWYESIDDEGRTYGEPINMGPMINTAEDEISPFFHSYTNTLYFSSNGLPGFGGLDVLRTTFNEDDSVWSAPKNMGQPINSSTDDAYFVMEHNQRHGYFSSDRKECADCKDGACYKLYAFDKAPNTFDLSGVVYNAENNTVIPNSLLTFKDIRGEKEPFYLITDSVGAYFTVLDEGVELYVKAQKNKYFGDAGNFSSLGITESQHFVKDFFLSPIPSGDIVIPGIEYDYDKATLRPASKIILDDLTAFLVLNNNLSVEISSHTDDRGSDVYNLKLSHERAKSCVDYLISKGIAADRLLAHGYGETKLLVVNAQTEEEHQKNRRTAFRPIKESDIKNKK
ncbi:MAG: hypothetical protein A3F72_09225 [Bacteroidetes bacterium RIFCSPLOWO2_12_FULL_35_15]|nr:MAG: hypothetical protein A3F72_09225 [Bacteroidetes bacterium RIFCSPLOWO2_12_FULL_35_15]